MAIAIVLPGFNNRARSVTPMFLLMDHFLYRFATFSEKNMKKIYWLEVWIFSQNPPLNPIRFNSTFICTMVSNAYWRVKFFKNVGNIWNYLCNRPTSTKYDKDHLSPLTHPKSILLTINPRRPCWITCTNFFKIRVVFHTLYLWNEVGNPQFFFAFLTQVTIWLQ